jgi:hypothetical protein
MQTRLLKKGSGQVFDPFPAAHEHQPDKKIKLYGYDK